MVATNWNRGTVTRWLVSAALADVADVTPVTLRATYVELKE